MARRRSYWPQIFLGCYLGMIFINYIFRIDGTVWSWSILIALITLPVLVIIPLPPSLFRRLGRVVGRVQRKVERRRQRSRSGVHEAERSYEQGYQANYSNSAQEFLVSQDAYELPQAQYPQQQLPPM